MPALFYLKITSANDLYGCRKSRFAGAKTCLYEYVCKKKEPERSNVRMDGPGSLNLKVKVYNRRWERWALSGLQLPEVVTQR